MSLVVLLADELRHLLRSRLAVMVLTAVPIMMAVGVLTWSGEDRDGLFFAAFLSSNLASLACGAMISTSLTAELQSGAPILFTIRPIPRVHLLLARCLAMVLTICAVMAAALALCAGLEAWLHPGAGGTLLLVRTGMLLCFACAALSGSLGVLVGVSASSMLGGTLLFLVIGMQLSNGVMLVFEDLCRWTGCAPGLRDASVLLGALGIASLLLYLSARIFARKAL